MFLNTQQMVTKLNKTAALMLNTSAEQAVGLQLSELLSAANSHLLDAMSKLTTRESEEELKEANLSQSMVGTWLLCKLGRDNKEDPKSLKIPCNFYAHRLTNELNKTYGFCLIIQPIIIK